MLRQRHTLSSILPSYGSILKKCSIVVTEIDVEKTLEEIKMFSYFI